MITLNKVNLTTKQNEALYLYASSVMNWNDCFNLTGAKNTDDFYNTHISSALALSVYIEEYIKPRLWNDNILFADIGSGEGIPLIPLSILLNNYRIQFYAVERSHKRCVFLRYICELLRSKGFINNSIIVNECDLKIVKKKFDIITFCALAKVDKIEKDLIRLLNKDGCIFAPKGRYENALKEISDLDTLKGEIINNDALKDCERTVLKLHF